MIEGLINFLRARKAEDETAAKQMATVYPPPWDVSDRGWMARVTADAPNFADVIRIEQDQAPGVTWLSDVISHIARHDPARVLATVAADLRIIDECQRTLDVEEHGWCLADRVLREMGTPYAGHPDYREEWRP